MSWPGLRSDAASAIDLDAVRREASVWAHAAGHPNAFPIINADVYDEQVVIVSEYAPSVGVGWSRAGVRTDGGEFCCKARCGKVLPRSTSQCQSEIVRLAGFEQHAPRLASIR